MTSGKTRPEAAQGKRDAAVAAEPVAVAAQPVAERDAAAVASESTAGQRDIKALAERVKARRKENGWTQADVAKKGGPSAGAISQIERCLIEEPAEDLLAKLDAALEWPSGTADGIVRGLVGAAS
ncbi:helix-turn-helix domain-containing protein [Nocardia sp. CA-145437]|uniref:helix-turn-helix domain-containing protein n=1 Tax=Nocardia sp. CA-145437 TaxID=3239980 RepID=UPI003D97C349